MPRLCEARRQDFDQSLRWVGGERLGESSVEGGGVSSVEEAEDRAEQLGLLGTNVTRGRFSRQTCEDIGNEVEHVVVGEGELANRLDEDGEGSIEAETQDHRADEACEKPLQIEHACYRGVGEQLEEVVDVEEMCKTALGHLEGLLILCECNGRQQAGTSKGE